MKLDILAFGAHPDDVELGAGGILAVHVAQGKTVGIVDLTRGELGSRGTPEIRDAESAAAAEILGCSVRENLCMKDGFIANTHENQLAVIRLLRKYRPEVVLMNAPSDRHPDHVYASALVEESCFKSGLHKLVTEDNSVSQETWRPNQIFKYLQFYNLEPDVVVDISAGFDKKMASIKAHSSQFYDPNSKEPETVIASKGFLESVACRAKDWGRIIGVDYAEPLIAVRHVGVSDLTDLK